jgi:anti-sigma B factor antagonist
MKNGRPVIVMQLPERLKVGATADFLREVEILLKADHPRMVFDFAEVRQIDSAGVDMLLHCLQQAIKRDGDLKLCSIAPEVAVILELTRVDRLFEMFENVADAVESFDGFPVQAFADAYPWYSAQETRPAV